MSTHIRCFCGEIRKIYILLGGKNQQKPKNKTETANILSGAMCVAVFDIFLLLGYLPMMLQS